MPITEIDQAWSNSLGLINKVLQRDISLSKASLLQLSRNGTYQMWLIVDENNDILAVCFSGFQDWQGKLVARIYAVAGVSMREWSHHFNDFQDQMRLMGATRVVFEGRKGWSRMIPNAAVRSVNYEALL